MYCLGMYYNTALIGIETNWSTYPVMELERLRYPKQYVPESVDDYTHKVRHSFRSWTSTKTRPTIISELIKAVREDVSILNDDTTMGEMLTFVRDEHYKPTAEEGAHDDWSTRPMRETGKPQRSCSHSMPRWRPPPARRCRRRLSCGSWLPTTSSTPPSAQSANWNC